MSVKELSVNLVAGGLKFAIVVSRFNDFLTRPLLGGAIDCLVRHGGAEKDIRVVWVPGANEIPLVTSRILKTDRPDAVIALGAVIQGATPHAELINSQVSKSLAAIGVQLDAPVINGVVCADNLEQAIERCGTKAGNKGWQAAEAAIEMAQVFRALA